MAPVPVPFSVSLAISVAVPPRRKTPVPPALVARPVAGPVPLSPPAAVAVPAARPVPLPPPLPVPFPLAAAASVPAARGTSAIVTACSKQKKKIVNKKKEHLLGVRCAGRCRGTRREPVVPRLLQGLGGSGSGNDAGWLVGERVVDVRLEREVGEAKSWGPRRQRQVHVWGVDVLVAGGVEAR